MYFDEKTKRIYLDEDHGIVIEELNTITIDDKKYYLKYLSADKPIGGNSSLFILYDKEGIEEEKVIKFCNFWKPNKFSPDWVKRRYGRFMNEIDALEKIKNHNIQSNIIYMFDEGVWNISDREFPFYIMEKADSNLKDYLLSHSQDIDFIERIKLFKDIFSGVKILHELDLYHRDIKPDNILLFFLNDNKNDEGKSFIWKIGDLGLVAHRDKDYDDVGEKIGPFGWLSPEAMNKYLTEKACLGLDCSINEYSDIFQLGKLFWFIFHYNVPIGQVKLEDFTFELPDNKDFVFDLIQGMLQYPKNRRFNKDEISERMDLLAIDFGI